MSQKLFIGNIPYDLGETDLKSIFEDGGFKVSEVKIVTDRFTGKSRGFGFVVCENEQEAENAISTLNGKQVGGRTLKVAVAKKKEEGGGDRGGRRWQRRPRQDRRRPNRDRQGGRRAKESGFDEGE